MSGNNSFAVERVSSLFFLFLVKHSTHIIYLVHAVLSHEGDCIIIGAYTFVKHSGAVEEYTINM